MFGFGKPKFSSGEQVYFVDSCDKVISVKILQKGRSGRWIVETCLSGNRYEIRERKLRKREVPND